MGAFFFYSTTTSIFIRHSHHIELDIGGYISLLNECLSIRPLLQTIFWLLMLAALTQLSIGKKYLYSTFSISHHSLD